MSQTDSGSEDFERRIVAREPGAPAASKVSSAEDARSTQRR